MIFAPLILYTFLTLEKYDLTYYSRFLGSNFGHIRKLYVLKYVHTIAIMTITVIVMSVIFVHTSKVLWG